MAIENLDDKSISDLQRFVSDEDAARLMIKATSMVLKNPEKAIVKMVKLHLENSNLKDKIKAKDGALETLRSHSDLLANVIISILQCDNSDMVDKSEEMIRTDEIPDRSKTNPGTKTITIAHDEKDKTYEIVVYQNSHAAAVIEKKNLPDNVTCVTAS